MDITRYIKYRHLKRLRHNRENLSDEQRRAEQRAKDYRVEKFAKLRKNLPDLIRERLLSDKALEARVIQDIHIRTGVSIPSNSLFLFIDWQIGPQLSGSTSYFLVKDLPSLLNSIGPNVKDLIRIEDCADLKGGLDIREYHKAYTFLCQKDSLMRKVEKHIRTGRISILSAFKHANAVKAFETPSWYEKYNKIGNIKASTVLSLNDRGGDSYGQGSIFLMLSLESGILKATQFLS